MRIMVINQKEDNDPISRVCSSKTVPHPRKVHVRYPSIHYCSHQILPWDTWRPMIFELPLPFEDDHWVQEALPRCRYCINHSDPMFSITRLNKRKAFSIASAGTMTFTIRDMLKFY